VRVVTDQRIKAWIVRLIEVDSVVLAETRSKARAATVRAANEAGYDVAFTAPARVTRAPEFDRLNEKPGLALAPEYARRALETTR
jgi:hypothetical protein